MKWYSYVIIFLLTLLVFLTSVLGTFFDDNFYACGYRHNEAFTTLGEQRVMGFTDDWQSFLVFEGDLYPGFSDDEQSHLRDVRELYSTGKKMVPVLMILVVLGFVISKNYFLLLRKAAKTILVTLGIIVLLSARWEWFFTLFHELLFVDNWTFSQNTLIITLWGGNFFVLAALYVGIKILLVAIIIYLLSHLRLLSNDERRG